MDGHSRIRRAWVADAPVLGALERTCFPDPWSVESFRELLREPGTVALVAELDGEVVGYMAGRAILDTAEILNLAVHPAVRGRGLGSTLLVATLDAMRARGAREVYLEVRESNTAAQSLYAHAGFLPVGRRAQYYQSPPEDALVFRLPLDPSGQIG